MITVNAMGDNCPIPVVKTLNAMKTLQGPDVIETLVDNEIAVQNLTRMASQKGCAVKSEKLGEKVLSRNISPSSVSTTNILFVIISKITSSAAKMSLFSLTAAILPSNELWETRRSPLEE